MDYYTDLFTVETYEAFLASDRTISGFRESQHGMASKIGPGDKLIPYIKGLSRWSGVLVVKEGPFIDRQPIFLPENDPFVVRFKVDPVICLDLDKAIPIRDHSIFPHLSFTKGRENGYWLGPLRRSLQHLDHADGDFLERRLIEQRTKQQVFPLSPQEVESVKPQHVKRTDGIVAVTVPVDDASNEESPVVADRDSTLAQADIARLGEQMGFRVWIPRGDRSAVTRHWTPEVGSLLDSLPLNYDDTTLKTIEQIDVLWLRGRAIQRAFEVEHTTAIYSGLLRMADLLALQPNMNIALHIVAPDARRDKVLSEIRRPVFSLIEHQPLSQRCTFIAYEALREIMALPHLSHISDSVLVEYEERAD